jgi:hypothetical protein
VVRGAELEVVAAKWVDALAAVAKAGEGTTEGVGSSHRRAQAAKVGAA